RKAISARRSSSSGWRRCRNPETGSYVSRFSWRRGRRLSARWVNSGLRAHPVVRNKMPAGKLEELSVGGMIDRFDTHHARSDRRVVPLQVLEQFQLGGRGTDDQNFPRILDGLGDFLVVLIVGGRLAGSDDALLVMKVGFVLR